MKTHLSLPTTDLPASVRFYSTLLDTAPTKRFDDYTLFVSEQPGLELALNPADSVAPAHNVHYGIGVESLAEVERAIERLEAAQLVAAIERGETCCYANQTKVWAVDPDDRRWEVYVVHEETQERDDPETSCCTA